MKLACAALVFSLFVLQKDPSGEPPLHYRPWPSGLCREQSWLQRLRNTFSSWQPDFCWVVDAPWGSWLAGVAMVLLCAFLDTWAASCLASPQVPPAGSAACLESETAIETDLGVPQGKCSLCLWEQASTSSSQSDDPPPERHRDSFETVEDPRQRHREKILYSEHKRTSSSSSSTQQSLQDRSSSVSSSPRFSSLCLSRLKNLSFLCTCRDPSLSKDEAQSQSSESERESSGSYYAPSNPSTSEEEGLDLQAERKPSPRPEPVPRGSLFLLEKCSETESPSLSRQQKEVQTQTSLTKINIIRSSMYKKENGVLFVEKSLQVQVGDVRLPRSRIPLPKPALSEEAGRRRKPTTLSLLVLPSLLHTGKARKGKRVASVCRLLGTFEQAPPPGREHAGRGTIFAKVGLVREPPSVMDKMDEDTKDFLEFHVKKKMVQWQCGMPSIVARSVAAFQSLLGLGQDKPAGDGQTPAGTVTLMSRKRLNVALHVSLQRARGPKRTSVLSSWKPENIHQLAFHAAVKRLEIKMGAFPEMVGSSCQGYRGPPEKTFPKVINSGNKMLRPKHPALPFLAQENICILELNIKRKWLAYAKNISIVYTKLAATVVAATISSRPRDSEAEPREQMAQLLVSIWRQIHMVEILCHGLNQRPPLPRPLESSPTSAQPLESSPSSAQPLESSPSSAFPSLCAGEVAEIQFQGALLKEQLFTLQVLAETPRPREEQPLAKGCEESTREKPPRQLPAQRALPPSLDQPEPSGAASRKEVKFRAAASIVRTSIFLELQVKKEKLNLHLKKKVRAQLRPPQGIGLEVTVAPRRKARPSPAPQRSHSGTHPLGRPRRSFCYVCMPSDESGTELKTVCWSLPKWILEMNGYRTPEVARFASRSRPPQLVEQ